MCMALLRQQEEQALLKNRAVGVPAAANATQKPIHQSAVAVMQRLLHTRRVVAQVSKRLVLFLVRDLID